MHGVRRAMTALVVGGMVMAGSVGTAGADPKGFPVQLHCGGTTYDAVTAGNGEFTPAHDLESNTVFIPLAFGEFSGTLTHVESGQVVDSFVDPATTEKGSAQPRGRTVMECTFTFVDEFTATEEDDGLIPGDDYRFEGSGEVTLFTSGRR